MAASLTDPSTWYDYIKSKATAIVKDVESFLPSAQDIKTATTFASPITVPILMTAGAGQAAVTTGQAAVTDGIKIASDPWGFITSTVSGDTSTFFADTNSNAPSQKTLVDNSAATSGVTAGTMPFWIKATIIAALLIGTTMIVKGSIEHA